MSKEQFEFRPTYHYVLKFQIENCHRLTMQQSKPLLLLALIHFMESIEILVSLTFFETLLCHFVLAKCTLR